MARVLVVDDDPITVGTFEALLASAGHEVDTALSAEDAVLCIRRGNTDVLLADLRLSRVSALDVLRILHSEGVVIPTVIVTGFGSVRDAVDAMKLGVVDFLEKPVDPSDLIRTIEDTAHQRLFIDRLPVNSPAADRWAELIMKAIGSQADPKTLDMWARLGHVSRSTLENRCAAIRVSPRASLNFARVLRAVVLGGRAELRPELFVDMDPRTLRRAMNVAGLSAPWSSIGFVFVEEFHPASALYHK
jgi:ActR/RegA family two-component response regulator